jgi:hypothetical protein
MFRLVLQFWSSIAGPASEHERAAPVFLVLRRMRKLHDVCDSEARARRQFHPISLG